MESASYPNIAQAVSEILPESPVKFQTQKNVEHVIRRSYRELIDYQAELEECISALNDDSPSSCIVGIDGHGGIGKTTLAYEVYSSCRRNEQFSKFVWISASPHKFDPNAPEGNWLTFSDVLDGIAIQRSEPQLVDLPESEKTEAITKLLHDQPTLIALDNLETSQDHQDEIVKRLNTMLFPSKALLTSRHRFEGDEVSTTIRLTGLSPNGAKQLIQVHAKAKGSEQLLNATTNTLNEIAEATGGSPLAINLVVGLTVKFSVELVLEHLKKGQPIRANDLDGDEYYKFFKRIFHFSWQRLTKADHKTLIALATFSPERGATISTLQNISQIEWETIKESIDSLWSYSFLESQFITLESGTSELRYLLHPLTRYFILSDILDFSEH